MKTYVIIATLALFILKPALSSIHGQTLTVERIDGYTYIEEPFFIYEPVSTMGVLSYPGVFRSISGNSVGGWMPSGPDAPQRYPVKSYWTFASYADLNVLRTTYPWLTFWWPTGQSTAGSGIVRVYVKASVLKFEYGRVWWRTVNGGRSVKLWVPKIENTSKTTRSGPIRVVLAAHRSTSVYNGTVGKIFAILNFSPLEADRAYRGNVRTTRKGRLKGRMRTAMHLMENMGKGYVISDTKKYSGTVRFR